MASGPEHDIKQITSLVETTLDSAQGYMDAVDEAKNSRFSTLFRERAAQRHDIAERLQTCVKGLGGKPEDTGTALGAAQRWFDNLKHMMAGSDASIIAGVEAGEDHVKVVYQKIVIYSPIYWPLANVAASAQI